ncbi:hypothetical protein PQU92_04290 [Asticcacaulis sp. BYS171W]|uniref:Uncharacterized protein n=1 Tax=Asticcacaulis aquaticus TaxID=2984212 RepID=A0ABT5HQX8_9CAUL|nr:hypothetical protein [Asticcacaulis aquaticus]MDC7682481.1 hypothetical protein [Asticcacaulis aquaticus]
MWRKLIFWLIGLAGFLLFAVSGLVLYSVVLDRLAVGDPEGTNRLTFLSLLATMCLGAFIARPAFLKLIALIKSQTR